LGDVRLHVSGSEAGEDVAEPELGIETIEAGGLEHGVEDGGTFAPRSEPRQASSCG
jgi:hypothetical protein